jgi:hypothetical protein
MAMVRADVKQVWSMSVAGSPASRPAMRMSGTGDLRCLRRPNAFVSSARETWRPIRYHSRTSGTCFSPMINHVASAPRAIATRGCHHIDQRLAGQCRKLRSPGACGLVSRTDRNRAHPDGQIVRRDATPSLPEGRREAPGKAVAPSRPPPHPPFAPTACCSRDPALSEYIKLYRERYQLLQRQSLRGKTSKWKSSTSGSLAPA